MTVDPFIEAEEAAGHGAKRACRLLEVSRSAYYERKKAVPSERDVTDAELTEKIKEVHDESKGTYGYLRVRKALSDEGTEVGKWRVRRLMRTAGLEGRAKKRWRTTTVADPQAEAAKDLIQRHFGPCEELDRRYVGDITYVRDLGRLGLPGHGHRPGLSTGRGLGAGRPHAHRARRRGPADGLRPAPTPRGRHLPLRPGMPGWNQLVVATP